MFLIDSYPYINTVTFGSMYSGSLIYRGQSFTNTNADFLNNAVFYIRKSGNPTGLAYAKIYAHSGTYGTNSVPTGSVLATSDAFDVSTLTTSYQLITFNFTGANVVALSAGTYYCIELNYQGGNIGNQIQIGLGGTGASGNWNYSTDGTSWYGDNTRDTVFYVYGATKVLRINAQKDENDVSSLLGTLVTDGITPVVLVANPANGKLKVLDGNSGMASTRINDVSDQNSVRGMMAVSSADGTPILLAADSNGNLLIKSD